MFYSLDDSDTTQLARQWLVACELVSLHCDGAQLDGSLNDLDLLQTLIDRRAWSAADTYELQCLGIALGRVLARNVDGLDWAIVDDEFGRDPTIRYRHTSFQVNVLTQISKRIERGSLVSVRLLYRGAIDNLAAFIGALN